jgi:hypothetical protein
MNGDFEILASSTMEITPHDWGYRISYKRAAIGSVPVS